MKIIGHRGAAGLAKENTLDSIRKAIDSGADEIEIDIRINAEGEAVLAHDLPIRKNSPTLREAIKLVNRKKPLIIELKPGESIAPVVDVIDDFLNKSWQNRDFRIASFDYKILNNIREFLPGVSLVVLDRWSGVRASYHAGKLGTKYIAMNQRWLWGGFIRSMTSRGWKLGAYTINDPAKAKKWQSYGLYSVTTDYPDKF